MPLLQGRLFLCPFVSRGPCSLTLHQATDASTAHSTVHNYVSCQGASPFSASITRINGSSQGALTSPTLFRAVAPEPSIQQVLQTIAPAPASRMGWCGWPLTPVPIANTPGGGLVAQSCPTLCDPTDCSPPGSSVHGTSRQYWSGLPFPSPGDLPDPGIKPISRFSRWILYGWAAREAQHLHVATRQTLHPQNLLLCNLDPGILSLTNNISCLWRFPTPLTLTRAASTADKSKHPGASLWGSNPNHTTYCVTLKSCLSHLCLSALGCDGVIREPSVSHTPVEDSKNTPDVLRIVSGYVRVSHQ